MQAGRPHLAPASRTLPDCSVSCPERYQMQHSVSTPPCIQSIHGVGLQDYSFLSLHVTYGTCVGKSVRQLLYQHGNHFVHALLVLQDVAHSELWTSSARALLIMTQALVLRLRLVVSCYCGPSGSTQCHGGPAKMRLGRIATSLPCRKCDASGSLEGR